MKALDWTFKKRVDQILQLVSERVSDSLLGGKFSAVWSQSLELAKIRNALAHNPLVFGWLSTDESGPPDFIGIPDVAHLGSKPRVSQQITSGQQMAAHINEAHAIASRLFEMLGELDAHLGNTSAQ